MQVEYSIAAREAVDDSVYEAVEPGEVLKIRVQPQIRSRRGATIGDRRIPRTYLGWRGVYWNLECTSVEEAISVRVALASFFAALAQGTPAQVTTWLDKFSRADVDSAPITHETHTHTV